MKTKYLALITGLLFCGNIFSQDIVADLMKFYEEADMAYYKGEIQKNVSDCYKAQCEYWKVDESTNPPSIHLIYLSSLVEVDYIFGDFTEHIHPGGISTCSYMRA
jgi:hypothetical protein